MSYQIDRATLVQLLDNACVAGIDTKNNQDVTHSSKKRRKCLGHGCNKTFLSSSFEHRMCANCRVRIKAYEELGNIDL